MENEIKTRSIRADHESFEKFKLVSEEFPNQAQALAALLSVYEIEKSKAILPERQTEIENFSMHVQKLNEIYNHALMLNNDTEDRIRSEFKRQMDSKDEVIADLRIEVNALREEAKSVAKFKKEKNEIEDQLMKQIQKFEKDLEKNEQIIESQKQVMKNQDEKIETMTKQLSQEKCEDEVDLKKRIKELMEENLVLQNQLKEKDKSAKLFEKELDLQNKELLMQQKNAHFEEIENMQKMYQSKLVELLGLTKESTGESTKEPAKKASTKKVSTKRTSKTEASKTEADKI